MSYLKVTDLGYFLKFNYATLLGNEMLGIE